MFERGGGSGGGGGGSVQSLRDQGLGGVYRTVTGNQSLGEVYVGALSFFGNFNTVVGSPFFFESNLSNDM